MQLALFSPHCSFSLCLSLPLNVFSPGKIGAEHSSYTDCKAVSWHLDGIRETEVEAPACTGNSKCVSVSKVALMVSWLPGCRQE